MTEKYNYEPIISALNNLKGIDKNKIEYIEIVIDLLREQYLGLSAHIGRLEGRKMLLSTAKGRTEYEYNLQDVETVFEEYSKAESMKNLIDKVVFLVQMKVKNMIEY